MADKAVTFWRRMDWRVWSHSYIAQTPEMERIAFVKPCHLQKPDQPEPAAEEQRIPSQIRDISLGGMVLVAGQRFESGTLLKIEVPGPNGQPSLNLLARVIQVTVQSQRAFVLSCCFAKELNEEDLRVFGAECVRAKEDDGRTWIRFACDAETTFHSVVDAEQQRIKGKIVNISAGGFAMQAERRFEFGKLLSIELAEAEDQQARPIMARVIHVSERPEGGWVLGCTFVSELSDND